jgi:hypothetical protein
LIVAFFISVFIELVNKRFLKNKRGSLYGAKKLL